MAVDKGDYVGNTQIYVPTTLGQPDKELKNIVEQTNSCSDDSALLDVGKLYYDHYIWACRSQVKILCKLMIPKVVRRPRCAGNGSIGLKESFREDYASGSCLQSLSGFLSLTELFSP